MKIIKFKSKSNWISRSTIALGLFMAASVSMSSQAEAYIGTVIPHLLDENQVSSSDNPAPHEPGKPWRVVDDCPTTTCDRFIYYEVRLERDHIWRKPGSAIYIAVKITRKGDFFETGAGENTETLYMAWNQSRVRGKIKVQLDQTPESDGGVEIQLMAIKPFYPDWWTKQNLDVWDEIHVDKKAIGAAILDDDPEFSIYPVISSVTEGGPGANAAFLPGITDVEFYFGSDKPLKQAYDLTAEYSYDATFATSIQSTYHVVPGDRLQYNTASNRFNGPGFLVFIEDDDIDEPDRVLYARISRVGGVNERPLTQTERDARATVTVIDNDEPEGAEGAEDESAAATSAALHYQDSCDEACEADTMDALADSTEDRAEFAFSRGAGMDVQSFFSELGKSVNEEQDLADLINLPAFALSLTSDNEFAGPVTAWGKSDKRTLGFNNGEIAVGSVGMDTVISESYLLGMSVSSSETIADGATDGISEKMNMVQTYAAYKPENLDLRLTAIVGMGRGGLVMDGFGTFETARTLAQLGAHSDLLDYQAGPVAGVLSLHGTAGISKHTVAETAEYYGWTTIGRDHALSVTNTNTIATAFGEFNPAVWAGFNDQFKAGGGVSFESNGLSAAAWFNGKSPDSAENLAVDVGYGFNVSDDTTIAPSASFTSTDEVLGHQYGLNITSGGLALGGTVSDDRRISIDGSFRW